MIPLAQANYIWFLQLVFSPLNTSEAFWFLLLLTNCSFVCVHKWGDNQRVALLYYIFFQITLCKTSVALLLQKKWNIRFCLTFGYIFVFFPMNFTLLLRWCFTDVWFSSLRLFSSSSDLWLWCLCVCVTIFILYDWSTIGKFFKISYLLSSPFFLPLH